MNEQMLAQLQSAFSTNNDSSNTDEKFKCKYRANICWLKPADNEKGYVPISLPFGIQLELSSKQRQSQLPESLQLMDSLLEIAKQIPEGESRELNPQIGGLCISIRHSGERKVAQNQTMTSALAALGQLFK